MSAIASELPPRHDDASRPARRAWNGGRLASLGYLAATLAVGAGWLVTRRYQLVDPLYGAGYWLGIVGASLMGLLLLYPVRKRVRLLRGLGATRHWFRLHMIFGVAGPVLILYHCNFRLGSLNSSVALVCTLLVAASGLVGRYLYTKIHNDLDGHRTSLQELVERARIGRDDRMRSSAFVPELLERIQAFDRLVLAPPESMAATLLLPVKLAFATRLHRIRLSWYARRQIAAHARRSPVVRAERRRLTRSTSRFIATHLRRVRRVAELNSYERMFSLWHVFHLPFFYILVLTALIHVLAVHMY